MNKNPENLQVRAERSDRTILEDWSQSLLISVFKRVPNDGLLPDEDELLPPLNFQAQTLSPSVVRLEWTPFANASSNCQHIIYFIIIDSMFLKLNNIFIVFRLQVIFDIILQFMIHCPDFIKDKTACTEIKIFLFSFIKLLLHHKCQAINI